MDNERSATEGFCGGGGSPFAAIPRTSPRARYGEDFDRMLGGVQLGVGI